MDAQDNSQQSALMMQLNANSERAAQAQMPLMGQTSYGNGNMMAQQNNYAANPAAFNAIYGYGQPFQNVQMQNNYGNNYNYPGAMDNYMAYQMPVMDNQNLQ